MALANPEIRLNRFRTVSIVSRRVRFIIHRPRRGAARRVARPEESSSCINRIAQRGATDCSDLINDRRRTVLRLIKRTLRWHWCIAAKIFFSNSMHLLAFVRDRLAGAYQIGSIFEGNRRHVRMLKHSSSVCETLGTLSRNVLLKRN